MHKDEPGHSSSTSVAEVALETAADSKEQKSRGDWGTRRRIKPSAQSFLIFLAFLVLGVIPVVLYVIVVQGAPAVTALEARRVLSRPGSEVVLVDIRDVESFADGHIPGAQNWPYGALMGTESTDNVLETMGGAELLLISDAGLRSAVAVRHLSSLAIPARHIHGGMQAWIATATTLDDEEPRLLEDASRQSSGLPVRSLSPFERLAVTGSSLIIKPIYMIAALFFIAVLWHRRAVDLAALRWGLVLFLAGETACVFNTIAFFRGGEQSDLFEYLHGLGMVLFLGLLTFSLMEGADRRLIHLSQPDRRCTMRPLCQECIKTRAVPCGLRRLFMLAIPLTATLVFIPLTATPHYESYNADLFGLAYNFTHPGLHQVYELRFLPLASLAFFALALLIIWRQEDGGLLAARIPFAAGLGALFYSVLMLALYTVYRDNLAWFIFWEESTELILVAAVGAVLWVFRRGLLPDRRGSGTEGVIIDSRVKPH